MWRHECPAACRSVSVVVRCWTFVFLEQHWSVPSRRGACWQRGCSAFLCEVDSVWYSVGGLNHQTRSPFPLQLHNKLNKVHAVTRNLCCLWVCRGFYSLRQTTVEFRVEFITKMVSFWERHHSWQNLDAVNPLMDISSSSFEDKPWAASSQKASTPFQRSIVLDVETCSKNVFLHSVSYEEKLYNTCHFFSHTQVAYGGLRR